MCKFSTNNCAAFGKPQAIKTEESQETTQTNFRTTTISRNNDNTNKLNHSYLRFCAGSSLIHSGFSDLGHRFILLGVPLSFVHEMACDSRSLSLVDGVAPRGSVVLDLSHSVDGSSSGLSL
jgi:hypothetical protein